MYTFLHWSLTYYKVVMPDIWSESLGLNAEKKQDCPHRENTSTA